MENYFKKFGNVFNYAAANEAMFEDYWRDCGHERKTTFFSDLSIGEWYGLEGVRDTYKRVMSEWLNNVEYITEFIACLGIKASQWAQRNPELCDLYSHLFKIARGKFYERYANDEYAKDYFFQMTD